MTDKAAVPDDTWRARMLADLKGENLRQALDALLSLTYNEPDRRWMEKLLLTCLAPDVDPQIRALSVTCLGHVARIHRAIDPEVTATLRELLNDPVLGGIVEDALGDIDSFVSTT